MITPLMSSTGNLNTSTVEYMGLMLHLQDPSAFEDRIKFIIPLGCLVGGLRVKVRDAPGTGDSWTFTLMKNSVATGLSVTISDLNTVEEDFSSDNVVEFVAGDFASIRITPSTPALTVCSFSILISADEAMILCNEGEINAVGLSPNASNSLSVMGAVTVGTVESGGDVKEDGGNVCPSDGVMSNLFVYIETPPGGTDTRTFTLYVNDVATALTTTLSGTEQTGFDIDPLHAATIAAGDKIYILAERAGGISTPSTRFSIGMTFAPNIADEVPYMASSYGDPTGTEYLSVASRPPLYNGTSVGSLSTGVQAEDLYVLLAAAPGGSETRTITMLKNGSATGLSVTLSGAEVASIDTGIETFQVTDDNIDYQLDESGAGAADPLNIRVSTRITYTGLSPFPFLKPMIFHSRTNAFPFIFYDISDNQAMIFGSRS